MHTTRIPASFYHRYLTSLHVYYRHWFQSHRGQSLLLEPGHFIKQNRFRRLLHLSLVHFHNNDINWLRLVLSDNSNGSFTGRFHSNIRSYLEQFPSGGSNLIPPYENRLNPFPHHDDPVRLTKKTLQRISKRPGRHNINNPSNINTQTRQYRNEKIKTIILNIKNKDRFRKITFQAYKKYTASK